MLGGSRCISQHCNFHCSAHQFSTILAASTLTSNSSFKNFRIRLRNRNSNSSCLSNKGFSQSDKSPTRDVALGAQHGLEQFHSQKPGI
ncbi:hypothetical protein KY284_019460 [Solanum tuberosum]|nr:hypothetical protein KY284_019460 [Solanum tuberosum]